MGERAQRDRSEPPVGVGPHPAPWPDDPRLDPELLAGGDRRNVVDRYRYWSVAAIREDLDRRRHPFHVAVENWRHDANIGAVVRNANAFLASAVHVVGERRWNRRGAMMTEVYQHVRHHPTLADFAGWARSEGLPVVGIDNLPGSRPLPEAELPRACVLLFGQEGPGLSAAARNLAGSVLHVPQYGSTRSINAGAASAVAMYEWCRRWAGEGAVLPPPAPADPFDSLRSLRAWSELGRFRPLAGPADPFDSLRSLRAWSELGRFTRWWGGAAATAIVPAAGRSRRMGRPKPLLPFGGGTVLGATLAALAGGGARRLCVVTTPRDRRLAAWLGEEAPAELARRLGGGAAGGPEIVAAVNPRAERGMLSTVLAGLDALGGPDGVARAGAPLLVCPADLPALSPATVAAVLARLAASGAALAVPVHAGRRGHPLAIAPRLVAEIPRLDLAVGLRQLLARHPGEVTEAPVDDPGCLRDLDTPADYRELAPAT